MQPANTVNKEGFLYFVKNLQPLYKVPSHTTITRRLEARYKIMKEALIKQLSGIEFYCITCDLWTDCSNQSYLGITLHFRDDNMKFVSRCLACFPLFERHTAENLGDSLKYSFQEFQIKKEKLLAIITDGEAAIKKAARELVGDYKHLICIAHAVAHLLPDVVVYIERMKSIIKKIKSIITLIKRSGPASDTLKKLQKQVGKSDREILFFIQDVETRWTSKIDMIERYLELEPLVYQVMNECDRPIDILNREEVLILKDVLQFMMPIKNVISEISGDSYPTCSLIIPIIHCLRANVDDLIPKTDVGKEFKTRLLFEIDRRFKDFEQGYLLSLSTLLDARFKKSFFKDPLAAVSAISRVNKLISSKTNLENNTTEGKNNHQQEIDLPTTQNKKSIWDYSDKARNNMKKATTTEPNSSNNAELEQYLKLQEIPRDSDPAMFWKDVEAAFPNLSKIGIRFMSILGTSVSSERLFSKAGIIKSDIRNRLSSEHLNMYVFLSSVSLDQWVANK